MRDRPAERAAVADLEVADERGRPREQRHRGRDLRARLDLGLRRARADPQLAGVPLDAAQLGDATDVDEVVEHREPQREHRHQALAAREHLRALAEPRDERDRVGQRRGRVVLERRGLHRFADPMQELTRASLPIRRRPGWPRR